MYSNVFFVCTFLKIVFKSLQLTFCDDAFASFYLQKKALRTVLSAPICIVLKRLHQIVDFTVSTAAPTNCEVHNQNHNFEMPKQQTINQPKKFTWS